MRQTVGVGVVVVPRWASAVGREGIVVFAVDGRARGIAARAVVGGSILVPQWRVAVVSGATGTAVEVEYLDIGALGHVDLAEMPVHCFRCAPRDGHFFGNLLPHFFFESE